MRAARSSLPCAHLRRLNSRSPPDRSPSRVVANAFRLSVTDSSYDVVIVGACAPPGRVYLGHHLEALKTACISKVLTRSHTVWRSGISSALANMCED